MSKTSKKARARLGSFAYQIRITLIGVDPPIWRRLLVKDNIDLHRLHQIIQYAMGWKNYHLYQFVIDGVRYDESPEDEFSAGNAMRASSFRLGDLALQAGDSFLYCYDFGDDWRHECEVEEITAVERGAEYPRCLAGARACPPEDCGGPRGYESMLSALRSRSHQDYKHWQEWLNVPKWKAEAFDLNAVDQFLRAVYSTRPRSSIRASTPRRQQ